MESTRIGAAVRHRDFYRKLTAILGGIDRAQGLESMLTQILETVTREFSEDLGIQSGRLYRDETEEFVIVRSFGSKGKELIGQSVPRSYAILKDLREDEVLYCPPDDPRLDRELEERLGVRHFAAFYVGLERQYLAAFGFDDSGEAQEIVLTLSALRYAIQHRLRELSLAGQLREARAIQTSSLPTRPPVFAGFELAGISEPAEEVGGDILDFLPIDDHLLGIAVGDASGHGMPAALQARDVITGLRMGVERDLKITAVMRRLNAVIHRGGLTSRFVSLFFGELESNGNFVYVNAGHDPGVLLRANGKMESLGSTGIVMGPVEDVSYRRELEHLDPGDLLLLYTDGVTERMGGSGELGLSGVLDFLHLELEVEEDFASLPHRVLRRVRSFGEDLPWTDDVSMLILRRKNDGN